MSLTDWKSWGLRPIVLFATTHTIVTILHEFTHALTAYVFHVPATLFHFAANIDRTRRTLNQLAIIAMAGPTLALCIGLIGWVAYRRNRNSRLGLPLLYLVMFGVGTFFGNLMSTAFVGDFSSVALTLQLQLTVRYGVSVLGVLLLCSLSFLVGMELRKWTPVGVSATEAMIGIVVAPAILGTGIALLVSLPMPSAFVVGRIIESSFWFPAAVGILVSRKQPTENRRNLELGWADVALLLATALVVRLMVNGIAFGS